jgi:uncharacterized protein DUF6600/FecR-like protein
MNPRSFFRSGFLILSCVFFAGVYPAAADSSHARIIRLSLVQGDVRFTRDAHGDPLADPKTMSWEAAPLNLPISQGYVVATDNGRATVEFENGAMAFLSENTVLEFYDLSLQDGALFTRLVLRQGSASFYVNPQSGGYFSVTGGDFTVEATSRAAFRVNNFDNGSNVDVSTGHVSVLHKKDSTPLFKGQSLSMSAGDDASVTLGRLPESDEFDQWVSGRIDSVTTATNASLQYASSSTYAPGFADLYAYGSWSSCGGYGFGWRPFGAGFNWTPFASGQWISDPSFGWTYVDSAAWGWAPYHYGGWLFDAGCGGWFYTPRFVGNPRRKHTPPFVHAPHPLYRAATAVFVRQNGKIGIVPMHPLDEKGKPPLNLEHGVFVVESRTGVSAPVTNLQNGAKWETLKSAPRDAFSGGLAATPAPVRVSRTLEQSNAGKPAVSLSKDSSIAYDPHEHRFVNSNSPAAPAANSSEPRPANGEVVNHEVNERTAAPSTTVATNHVSPAPATARGAAPPSRSMTPPPPSRSSGFQGSASSSHASSGGGTWSGSSGRSSSSSASSGSSHASSGSSSGSGGRAH